MKLKLHDKMEILINNEVLVGEIDGISTRESDLEFWEYYSIKLDQKGWSISLSHCTEKEESNNKNEL